MKIGFIGGGTMAEAILGGMLDAGVAPASDVTIGEPVPARRDYLAERYGVAVTGANDEVINACELISLAVKPQDLSKVYADIGGSLGSHQSVLSIAAGATMKSLASGMQHERVIRVMPNTPAQIGEGMTMWTCAPSVSQQHRDATDAMLSTIGDSIFVDDEKYMDMATALSASGPAYVFLIVEALIDEIGRAHV